VQQYPKFINKNKKKQLNFPTKRNLLRQKFACISTHAQTKEPKTFYQKLKNCQLKTTPFFTQDSKAVVSPKHIQNNQERHCAHKLEQSFDHLDSVDCKQPHPVSTGLHILTNRMVSVGHAKDQTECRYMVYLV
jgi:hypothetical protein